MSDTIETERGTYFHESHLKLANANTERRGKELDQLKADRATFIAALKEAKVALERVWDEDECGWIIDPEIESKEQECVKCGAIVPNQDHAEDCTQGFIHKSLTTINKALGETEGK